MRVRRTLAAIVDACVGGLPALLLVGGWLSVVQGTIQAGFGALLYYGVPLLLFTGTVGIWAYWTWRAHQGTLPLRSVGFVVAGLQHREGIIDRCRLRPHTVGGVALRLGATGMAIVNVLAVGFSLYQTVFVAWSFLTN